MRRPFLILLMLLALAAAAIAALPWVVSSERVRAGIVNRAEELTGRQIWFRDAPKLLFSPFLGIEIKGVVFEGRNQSEPLAEMEALRGRLSVLAALFGRIEVTEFQFVRPRFMLHVDAQGVASWEFPNGRVWRVLDAAREMRASAEAGSNIDLSALALVRLGRFNIVDGAAQFVSDVTGTRETATNINMTIDWQDTARAASATGGFIWRDEAIRVAASAQKPLLLMAGGTSAVRLEVGSGAFDARFAGDANMLADLHLAGNADFSTPSLRRLLKFAEPGVESEAAFGSLSLGGKVSGTTKLMQIADVKLNLDGNAATGALQFARTASGLPKVSGTLDFPSFDFAPYVAAYGQYMTLGRPFSASLSLLQAMEADLRISAGAGRLGDLAISDIAAAVMARNSTLQFDLGNAEMLGGSISGSLVAQRDNGKVSMSADASLDETDLSAISALYPSSRIALQGRTDLSLSVQGSGPSLRELVASLKAKAEISAGAGLIKGIAFARVAPDSDAFGAAAPAAGETPFSRLRARLALDGASLRIEAAQLANTAVTADMYGSLDTRSGGLAMSATLWPPEDAPRAPPQFLFVGGIASAPLVTRLQYVPVER